jgi:O-antigen/teichoic acid export membrane protein
VANVCFNIWLIPIFGLPGAAIATFLSVTCYNLFGAVLVRVKFGMQPFSRSTALVVVLAVGALAATWFLPATKYPLVNIVLRSGLFALLFGAMVLGLRVSEDISSIWDSVRMRVRSVLRKLP